MVHTLHNFCNLSFPFRIMKQEVWLVFSLVAVLSLLEPVVGSRGDLSYVFQKCYGKCVKQNCTGPAAIKLFRYPIPYILASSADNFC